MPTAAPPANEQPAAGAGIVITTPSAGAPLQSPARIQGTIDHWPFEASLGVTVYDAEGNILAETGITTTGEQIPGPQTFDAELAWHVPATTQAGKIVVYESSPRDGSIMMSGQAAVTLLGSERRGFYLALPAPQSLTSLPLHVEALGVEAGARYTLRLTWADGVVLEAQEQALASGNGGALVANLAWATESAPPVPTTTEATLEIIDPAGTVVASQPISIIGNTISELLMPIKLYFAAGEELVEVTRYVRRTDAVATAALRELSWGPAGNETAAAGFTSLLPGPAAIAAYPGRQPDWRPRARLNSVRIADGVAYVDWSKELAAWGGGATALGMLTRQVEQTLGQFPSITSVQMTVDGSDAALQP